MHKKDPQKEHEKIEDVLEEVTMQEIEPQRVVFGKKRNGHDTQRIEDINTPPTERDIPQLVQPATAGGEQQAEPDKRLLNRCATPYDDSAYARFKEIGIGTIHKTCITEQTDNPIRLSGNMLSHEIERRGDVYSKPRNHRIALVANDGVLP